MLQRVDTVLIGKKCPSTYTTADALVAGDVALFDENGAILKTAADAKNAKSLYVGVAQDKISVTMPDGSVAEKANIKFSNAIQKNSKPSFVIGEYAAPVQEKLTFTLTDATIVAGNRYVIRIVYKDIYEAAWQFSHSYEIYAESATATNLVKAFADKINAHKNRRVQAVAAAGVLTLTALPKTDNEGVYSLSEYSVVSMEGSLFTTTPGALLSNFPKAVSGATIAKTVGNPGKGFWKQVRDAEVRYMGYQGHVFTGAYPIVEQKRMVQENATYDYATIENDNFYLSNDNQYIKTTPLVTELYVNAGTLKTSIVAKGIEAFVTGNVPS